MYSLLQITHLHNLEMLSASCHCSLGPGLPDLATLAAVAPGRRRCRPLGRQTTERCAVSRHGMSEGAERARRETNKSLLLVFAASRKCWPQVYTKDEKTAT